MKKNGKRVAKQKKLNGLTLIEILFACSFLVLIFVLVSTIFDRNARVYRKITSADERREECRFAMESIITELRLAEDIISPNKGQETSSVQFIRSTGNEALRKGEIVTYHQVGKNIERTSDKSSPVVILGEINRLTFTRDDEDRINITISIPAIETGSSSEFVFESMACIRKKNKSYCKVTAPAAILEKSIINYLYSSIGGI